MILEHSQDNQVDALEGISTYGKLELQTNEFEDEEGSIWKMGLPVVFTLTNIRKDLTDLEINMSQDTKEPTDKLNAKKIVKRHFLPGSTIKFAFGESNPDFVAGKKFPNQLFFRFFSNLGCCAKANISFTKKLIKQAPKQKPQIGKENAVFQKLISQIQIKAQTAINETTQVHNRA